MKPYRQVFLFAMVFILLVSTASEMSGYDVRKLDAGFRMLVAQSSGESADMLQTLRAPLAHTDNTGITVYEAIVYTDTPDAASTLGIEANTLSKNFFTARLTAEQIASLSSSPFVRKIESPKVFHPLLNLSIPEMKVDKLHSGLVNSTQYRGKGVIIGIIDTGIDWKHLDFRSDTDTTKSRIIFIWDQTISGIAPSNFNYGVEYTQTQINNEIDGSPANLVKEQDINGHGTHVASIAAGDGSSSGSGFKGVAPEADLIIVKAGDGSFSSTNVIDAITYVRQKAETAQKPFVINLSLGSHDGAHDGTDAEEVKIGDEVAAAGRAIVVAAGNEGSDAIHTDSTVAQGGAVSAQFRIPVYTPNGGTIDDKVFFDMWYKSGDQLTVSITSPNGSTVTASRGQSVDINTTSGDGGVQILNAPTGPETNGANNCFIALYDKTVSAVPRAGTWTLSVTGANITQGGTFDIWLTGATMSANDGSTPEFITGQKFRKLVAIPGTADKAITVGSYVTKWSWQSIDGGTYTYDNNSNRTGDYSLFSSPGPTRDGRTKPEVMAPGQAIVAARSSSASFSNIFVVPDAKHVIDQGTSMASPHVAGLAALMLQAKPALTAAQIKSILTSTCRKDNFTSANVNMRWGYGKVDAMAAMQTVTAVAAHDLRTPARFSLKNNYPNPFNPSTTIVYSLPEGRTVLVGLTVYDVLGRETARLVQEYQSGGEYAVTWDAGNFPSGVYYAVLSAHGEHASTTMVLVK